MRAAVFRDAQQRLLGDAECFWPLQGQKPAEPEILDEGSLFSGAWMLQGNGGRGFFGQMRVAVVGTVRAGDFTEAVVVPLN